MASDLGTIKQAIAQIISQQEVGTQAEICAQLEAQGLLVSQSKISRLLRLIGVSKRQVGGRTVYQMPTQEEYLPSPDQPISDLITEICHNESTIVVVTIPGAAQIIARQLDSRRHNLNILGIVAGDDTIFVAPVSTHNIEACLRDIKRTLAMIGSKDYFSTPAPESNSG